MGDRALVVFYSSNGDEVSPIIYLHWNGRNVPAWLEATKSIMTGRMGDAGYAAARFCGYAASQIPGNLSLGLMNVQDAGDLCANPEKYSHGDAGLILVNADTFEWKSYGGYLKRTA